MERGTVADSGDRRRDAGHARAARPPWLALETLRPLALPACRRLVVVAPHPRDEIRAAGGLLRRLAAGRVGVGVDVLSLTRSPTRSCPSTGGPVLPDVDALLADLDLSDRDLADDEDDADPEDPEETAAAVAHRALGLVDVRRHRLGLPDGTVAAHETDVLGAISEIVGFADDPAGLCVLAPWSGDGDDDHEAAGRAAEIVTAAYRVRLVRWLDQAWSWAGPESAEVPWRRARQVPLSESALARKTAASAAFAGRPGHDADLPDGSAPGPREVFLV